RTLRHRAQFHAFASQEFLSNTCQRVRLGGVLGNALLSFLRRRVDAALGLPQCLGGELARRRQAQGRADHRFAAGLLSPVVEEGAECKFSRLAAVAEAHRPRLVAGGLDDEMQPGAAAVGNLAPPRASADVAAGDRGKGLCHWGYLQGNEIRPSYAI